MRRLALALVLAAALPGAGVLYLAFQGWDRGPERGLAPPADLVVLVTLDGVRPDELLDGPDPLLSDAASGGTPMPFLMQSLVPRGAFLGDTSAGGGFGLGNPIGISIPSYQSIFTGRLTACLRNECGPPLGSTLLDDIAEGIGGGAEIGFYSYASEICGAAKVAAQSGAALCGEDGREADDAAVLAAALARLDRAPPRFLYIALGAADRIAHGGDYAAYLETLRRSDEMLAALDARLAALRADGLRITLIVTTDHGRGGASEWTEHVWHVAGTGRMWLLAEGHAIAPAGRAADAGEASLYDLRATIGYLLGLDPARGPFHGRVLAELLGTAPQKG